MITNKPIPMTTKELLDKLDKATTANEPIDRALYLLLRAYENRITGLVEDDPGYFHKAFRQTVVTDNGHVDAAIWILLNEAKIFWEVFGKLDKQDNGE